jgi:hypothetical protein
MSRKWTVLDVILIMIIFVITISANTCPVGTTINEPESSYIYSWNVISPDADLRAAQIGGTSGSIYYMGWIRNNNTCSTIKENPDGTVAWCQNYYTQYVQWKSFVVDNSETYLYTIDVNNPSNDLEIMQQSASSGTIIKFATS